MIIYQSIFKERGFINMNELDMLLEQKEILFKSIMYLETKSFFVKAYVKFIKSDDYQLYKVLKEKQLMDNTKEIEDKIKYLETYGAVSDIIYLINNCDEVKQYISLIKLNKRINNDIIHLNNKTNKSKLRVIGEVVNKK